MNKKIRNATPKDYDGIHFRSITEVRLYRYMKKVGLSPLYEPDKILLLDSFRPSSPWYMDGKEQVTKKGKNMMVQQMTYTPDFRLDLDETTVYIEAKGNENDVFPVKRKIFLHWIERQNKPIIFAEIKTVKGLMLFLKKIHAIA